jgi:hypothetical protein
LWGGLGGVVRGTWLWSVGIVVHNGKVVPRADLAGEARIGGVGGCPPTQHSGHEEIAAGADNTSPSRLGYQDSNLD